MDRETLLKAWTGENGHPGKHRPQWVRQHLDALSEHTTVELPDAEASNAEFREWLDSYKGTVTRQLNDDVGGSDPHDEVEDGETPTAEDTETEA